MSDPFHGEKIRLAIIGAGAVAETHLPVAIASSVFDVTVIVDKAIERARGLADQFKVPAALDNYLEIGDMADAAIVALPHHLHAPVAMELLQKEIHVLVEKPMALSTRDCDAMIAAARENHVRLAIGQLRRFFYSNALVKSVLERGLLGAIIDFDLREGTIFNWPAKSDFIFRRETGGGVLADTGAHALDTLLWWFGGCEAISYFDDSMGGVEADCEIHLKFRNGAQGNVVLSRTRNLRNTCIIRGECATLEVETKFNSQICLKFLDKDINLVGRAMPAANKHPVAEDVWSLFRRQLDDFGESILTDRSPFVPGLEGRRVVEVIEYCLANKRPLRMPWIA